MFAHRRDDGPVDTEDNRCYRKIGRTVQAFDKRAAQWGRPLMLMGWVVKYNEFAERIIHLFLDEWRVYRLAFARKEVLPEDSPTRADKKRYLSHWKRTGSWVKDTAHGDAGGNFPSECWTPAAIKRLAKKADPAVTRGKEIEWFYAEEDALLAVCSAVVLLINSWE